MRLTAVAVMRRVKFGHHEACSSGTGEKHLQRLRHVSETESAGVRNVRGRKLRGLDHINVKMYNYVFSFLFQDSERFRGCLSGSRSAMIRLVDRRPTSHPHLAQFSQLCSALQESKSTVRSSPSRFVS